MFFIRTVPGSSISPDSMTSTSGRFATSSAERSSGRATSVITQPGFTAMMSRTRLPAPEVAVTMRSMSARCSSGVAATLMAARGCSRSRSFLSASSFAVSGETSHSSSADRASSREQTEPIAPVAPTTITFALIRPSSSTSEMPSWSIASCAAHSAPEAL